MTREEAIAYGNDYYRDLTTACCEIDEKHKEFVRMSLEALEQEPCKTQMIDKSNFSQEQYKADLQCAYDCGKASVKPCEDAVSRQAVIDAFHTWFRDGFDEDKWWNSTHVLAAIEGIPSVHQKHKWETCFDCPLSHSCPEIKGCTNEQAIEYASKIPNDCPLSAQLERKTDRDAIRRSDMLDAIGHGTTYTSEELQKIIKALPPVNPLSKDYNTIYYTPQPKTGHWIKDDITERSKSAYKHKCDRCGAYHRAMYDYCPSCGAKMIEPQESEGIR